MHPELLTRLISTLRRAGESNQFILVTHSSELISSSLDETVLFLTPPKQNPEAAADPNQAVRIEPRSEVTTVLHRLGQSVGVVSLGKRIVLIEGADSSLDKKTYGRIIDDQFPNLVLVPTGGKAGIQAFAQTSAEILEKTLWGIQFFMLTDRDSSALQDQTQTHNYRVLSRYHLENYFLDAAVLSQCFADIEGPESWLRSPDGIEDRLRVLAKENLAMRWRSMCLAKLGC